MIRALERINIWSYYLTNDGCSLFYDRIDSLVGIWRNGLFKEKESSIVGNDFNEGFTFGLSNGPMVLRGSKRYEA